jgi:hypothetical protein
MKRKNVLARLKVHLLLGKTITQKEAYKMWRTTRLASYVRRLRVMQYDIHTEIVYAKNGDQFGRYSLKK